MIPATELHGCIFEDLCTTNKKPNNFLQQKADAKPSFQKKSQNAGDISFIMRYLLTSCLLSVRVFTEHKE